MFLRADDLTVHVQQAGPRAAPCVLLLHSLGTNLHVWDAQASALAGDFHIIRADLRGHGLTATTPGPTTMQRLAADMLAVLDALGIATAHIGGVSIGGMVAQAMAAAAPTRITSLMLCDTALAIPPASLWHDRAAAVRAQGMAAIADAVLARWVTPAFLDTPTAAGMRAMLLTTTPEGYAAAAEALATADLTQSTKSLRQPTLVLVGAEDLATPLDAAKALVAAIPGARLAVIAGAAHIPMLEQADAVTMAMRGFLGEVGERR